MATTNPLLENYNDDRRPALYASVATMLIINNLAVATRCWARWQSRDRLKSYAYLEDIFIVLAGALVDMIGGNLLAATHYGLGLHQSRVFDADLTRAGNLASIFRHVWICMVLFSPTFTAIKFALLFFYRRVFFVQQRWLRIAWWANMIYLIVWVFGATGFYLFQCWPVQWYYLRYFSKLHVPTPGGVQGQCNATTVINVGIPLIFNLVSDLGLLLLPVTAILKLHVATRKKVAIAGVFGVGVLACVLGLARLLALELDTDDGSDPSWGVAVFLILSFAEAVCAVVCASLPVAGPQLFKEYRAKYQHSQTSSMPSPHKLTASSKMSGHASTHSQGFRRLGGHAGDCGDLSSDKTAILPIDIVAEQHGMNTGDAKFLGHTGGGGAGRVGIGEDVPGAGIRSNHVAVETISTGATGGMEQAAGIVVKSEVHVTRPHEAEDVGDEELEMKQVPRAI